VAFAEHRHENGARPQTPAGEADGVKRVLEDALVRALTDDEAALVTSADFTRWAQQRNVKAGAPVRSRHFTRQLGAQFDSLAEPGQVKRLAGL